MLVQAVGYNFFSSGVTLPYFSMLAPLLALGSKSPSVSLGFNVHK